MFVEEAVWTLLNNDEEAWASEIQGKFLHSLLDFPSSIHQFQLI